MRFKEWGILGVIICLVILFSYPYHQGISPFDSGDYLKCAVNLLHGHWDITNFYSHRVGTYLPIALTIKLFGFSPQITWVSAAELALFILALFVLLRKYNPYAALVTCALVGFLPDIVVMSGQLLGDVLTMATTNLCILWIWYARDTKKTTWQLLSGITLAILWYIAFLVKESAFFYLIPILVFFILDFKDKRNRKFWLGTITTAVLLGVFYLWFYYVKTGDILYRLHAVEAGPNVSESNYSDAPFFEILQRLTFQPLKFLTENFSYFAVLLAGLIQLFSKPKNENEKFFNLFLITVLACWWFGTQSLTQWNPVALISRLWLPVLVPLCINSAVTLYHISIGEADRYRNNYTKAVLIILGVTALSIPFLNSGNVFWQQNPFVFLAPRAVTLLAFYAIIFQPQFIQTAFDYLRKNIAWIIIIGAFGYYNIKVTNSMGNGNSDFQAEKEILKYIETRQKTSLIIVETALYRNHGIYTGFADNTDLKYTFIDWQNVDSNQVQKSSLTQPVYFMINDNRLWYYKNTYTEPLYYAPTARKKLSNQIPYYFLHLNNKWKLIKHNTRVSLYLYTNK